MTGGEFTIRPIGVFHCGERYRYETPRQGVFADNEGVIELVPGLGYEEAAADLVGFARIWVLFVFHLNETWNIRVRPPVVPPGRHKIGVFATRSPHRPNRIGMSCVELVSVAGNRIRIRNFDLLDRTPVVDIKPYIPRADAFPGSAAGWLDEAKAEGFKVGFTPAAAHAMELLAACGGPDLERFCRVQLVHAPLDHARKRLYPAGEGVWEIGFRTWRIRFCVEADPRLVRVLGVRSNYTADELAPDAPDPYGDKTVHRAWLAVMPVQQDF